MSGTTNMRCAACGHSQLIAFPSITVEGRPDEAYEKRALEVGNTSSANQQTVFYACPNCGTLRIRIKTLGRGQA